MPAAAGQPAQPDRCPYVRAFGEDFGGCAAFVPQTYRTVDFNYRPTQPVLSCAHLTTGSVGELKHYYPRCRLGDAGARERWVRSVSESALRELRVLSAEYRAWVAPRLSELWTIKSHHLAALAANEAQRAARTREQLRQAVEDVVASALRFLADRQPVLQRLEMDTDQLGALIQRLTEHWAFADLAATADYQIPAEVLARFPPRLRLFVTAGRSPAAAEIDSAGSRLPAAP